MAKAQVKATASDDSGAKEETTVASFTVETEPAATEVIIRKKKKKKKKNKKKYTKGLKSLQQLEQGSSRASRRIADGIAEGYDVYYKRRNKSARKRKDGALRDYPDNLSYAISRGLETASRAPYDFTRELNTNLLTRQVRDFAAGFTTFFST